jgi:endonuclease YncB( thermonuclease family)
MVAKPGKRAKLDASSSHPYPSRAMLLSATIRLFSRPLQWAIIATLTLAHPVGAGEKAVVSKVIDGDTVVLVGGNTVRYIGIDTPEVRHRQGKRWVYNPQPFAEAATAENRRLVAGKQVWLETDSQKRDRYGRRLAYVYLGEKMVNEHLVRQGLARAKTYPPNRRHEKRLKAAQNDAKRAGRGIWANTQHR